MLRIQNIYLAIIDAGIYIDKQYDRIEQTLKKPSEELSAHNVNEVKATPNVKTITVPINSDAGDEPLSSAPIEIAKQRHINAGPTNSKSSNASFGDIFLV